MEVFFVSAAVNKSRGVEQVKPPCVVGILVSIGTYVFLDVGCLGLCISDRFASDEVDDLAKQ